MFVTELETFVQKFHQLWSAGQSAHLDLEAHAGRAWVGLRVQLGHVPGPLHHQLHPQPNPKVQKKKDSPSRQRRRARRAAARQASAEEVVDEGTENEKLPNEDAEEAKESEQISTSVKVVVNEAKQVSIESENVENDSNEATVQVEKENEAEQASTENIEDTGDLTVTEEATVVEEITDELCNDAEYLETSEKQKELERVVIVHALATFENSPNANLEQEDVNSLNKYIHSEKHLKDNICQVELFVQSKWEIAVKMHVVTTKLWEGPRQYVWKHLGASNFWSRGNGTKIRMSRIHVK